VKKQATSFFEKKEAKKLLLLRARAVAQRHPHRHCERSEAIHLFNAPDAKDGLLRCARNDGRMGPS
jgi:hypothetical protein